MTLSCRVSAVNNGLLLFALRSPALQLPRGLQIPLEPATRGRPAPDKTIRRRPGWRRWRSIPAITGGFGPTAGEIRSQSSSHGIPQPPAATTTTSLCCWSHCRSAAAAAGDLVLVCDHPAHCRYHWYFWTSLLFLLFHYSTCCNHCCCNFYAASTSVPTSSSGDAAFVFRLTLVELLTNIQQELLV